MRMVLGLFLRKSSQNNQLVDVGVVLCKLTNLAIPYEIRSAVSHVTEVTFAALNTANGEGCPHPFLFFIILTLFENSTVSEQKRAFRLLKTSPSAVNSDSFSMAI